VVELFLNQQHNKYRVSSKDSERFFLTKKEAATLIIEKFLNTGEVVFYNKYKVMKIVDLVRAINDKAEIEFIGLREGEKEQEEFDSKFEKIYFSIDEIKEMIKEFKNE
jgi:FlaA1/EpsC-like NDP-sugar epimerase